ncbi:M4 family metallopeptidase [Chelatococcus sambhunathii]|uniref:M4 family metallopeptidase n=1 Tax=Chelatococcus sambhunathii TaxID=363953 RepID=A0ABU1DJ75_9HYPH|nr:M4 family metallopeptidase [Chelatococcus sambhunathii]MDR4308174.1 M4 family metallopeptidase [Chelatococcus sambhunathii]
MPSNRFVGGAALAVALLSVSSLEAVAQSAPEISRSSRTGLVVWMSGAEDAPVAKADAGGALKSPAKAAADFLDGQSSAFGLRKGSGELKAVKTSDDGEGRDFVRFQQSYEGVPILGAELNVQLDAGRNVVSVNGKTTGDVNVSTTPAVTAAEALKTAIQSTAGARKVSAADLKGSEPELSIHDARVMGGRPAPVRLVWRVEVGATGAADVDEFVLVDAQNGRVVLQFSQLQHAGPPANAQQWVCDAANSVSKYPCTETQIEANPGSSSVPDVKQAFTFAEATYDLYARRFGRNSLDGLGQRLTSTVRYQRFAGQDYQNAFFSSQTQQMVYGKDFAIGSDVVGHELTHGVTSHTSKLYYYYQSGAINESLSDAFGQFVQRSITGKKEWLLGEDLPIGAIRDMKNPPAFNQPDKMTSTFWTGDFSFFDQGGVHTNSGVNNKAVYLITDGGTFNGKTVRGLGLDKAAALYYRVNSQLLWSSSDYVDLANALKQACKDLVGKKPKDKSGKPVDAFTKKDCKQVKNAIAATEMYKDPQFWPIPAEAKVCPSNTKPVNKLLERFEAASSADFKLQPSSTLWAPFLGYAASGDKNMYVSYGGLFSVTLSTTAGVAVPSGAYLRFAQYVDLYTVGTTHYAGGVVEYSTTEGVWVRVPASMFLDNPYNVTVAAGTGNVLAGQAAFGDFSGGWTSSRIDLSSLAGKTVKFRFLVGTASQGTATGWMVDDVQVYSCKSSKDEVAASPR